MLPTICDCYKHNNIKNENRYMSSQVTSITTMMLHWGHSRVRLPDAFDCYIHNNITILNCNLHNQVTYITIHLITCITLVTHQSDVTQKMEECLFSPLAVSSWLLLSFTWGELMWLFQKRCVQRYLWWHGMVRQKFSMRQLKKKWEVLFILPSSSVGCVTQNVQQMIQPLHLVPADG